MTLRLAAFLLIATLGIAGAAFWLVRSTEGHPAIAVANAWMRPAGADEAAAVYLEIENGGDAGDELTGATTPVAAKAEIHAHQMQGDVMEMRAVPSIDIHANENLAFSPGGLHLMMTGLNRQLALGDHFPLTLEFSKAGAKTVDVMVVDKNPVAGNP